MNFPLHQQTGAVAELRVMEHFMDWGWNVGTDRLDIGYDLFVTPDRDKYATLRFLVQVKGTARRKSAKAIVAPADKARLRQYAGDALPVFIVRVMPDRVMYWEHAQAWARTHAAQLAGAGSAGVRFDPGRRLDDRDAFERYLTTVLLPLAPRPEPVADLDAESRVLSALDPRLKVRVRATARGKEHEVTAAGGEVAAHLSFVPAPGAENVERLRDALEFGLPRSIDVDRLATTGSPLFERLDAEGASKGTLTLSCTRSASGVVRLHAGPTHSLITPTLSIDADLYTGMKGIAITNEGYASPLFIQIRQHLEAGKVNMKVLLNLQEAVVGTAPLQDLYALAPIATWAEKALEHSALRIELRFGGARDVFTIGADRLDEMEGFLHRARQVSRLHLIARALDSDFVLDPNLTLGASELEDINLAYALLHGDRPAIKLGPFEFEPQIALDSAGPHAFMITSTLRFEFGGRVLGDVPVRIDLVDYQLHAVEGTPRLQVAPGPQAKAYIAYDDAAPETRPAAPARARLERRN